MKTSMKALQNINGLSNLKTTCGDIKKSGKPDLPTTAVLELWMRRSERDRITKELERLKKRKEQLREKLNGTEKSMTKIFARVIKSAEEMRGNSLKKKGHGLIERMGKDAILEY